jgi:two-component system OmpR family sensor kinase
MTRWTIRQRLVKTLIGLVAVLWISGVTIAGFSVRHELDEVFDSALRETTGQIIPVALHQYRLMGSAGADVKVGHGQTTSFQASRGHVHYYLQDPDGAVLVASDGAPGSPPPGSLRDGFRNINGFRYYSKFLSQDQVRIVVAQELKERHEAAVGLWLGLASPLLALLPLAVFAILRTVNRATEPLARVSRELEARGGDHLEPIDGAGLPGELTSVIDATNTLMERLKAAIDSERAFAANAAHELRNPIASARAQIQLLAANLKGTSDSVRAENVASQLGQLGRRVEKLLQMARTQAGLGHRRERSNLAVITGMIVDEYAWRPDVGARLSLDTTGTEMCWVAMDQDALAIVLRNVIENAVHHGDAGAPITVRVTADHSVRVTNGCATIPADMLAELKKRFRRGGAPGSPGDGLGLAIVDALMRQAGAEFEMTSPAEGRADGFEILLKFPGAI